MVMSTGNLATAKHSSTQVSFPTLFWVKPATADTMRGKKARKCITQEIQDCQMYTGRKEYVFVCLYGASKS
jgi:hypothetical protein